MKIWKHRLFMAWNKWRGKAYSKRRIKKKEPQDGIQLFAHRYMKHYRALKKIVIDRESKKKAEEIARAKQ